MIKYNIIFLRLFHFQPKFCIIYIQHFILSIKLCANAAHCATEMFSTQVPKAANEKTNETKMAKEMNQEKLQFSTCCCCLCCWGVVVVGWGWNWVLVPTTATPFCMQVIWRATQMCVRGCVRAWVCVCVIFICQLLSFFIFIHISFAFAAALSTPLSPAPGTIERVKVNCRESVC